MKGNRYIKDSDRQDVYCLIYEAFARRGLGYYAEDMKEDIENNPGEHICVDNFDLPPECIDNKKLNSFLNK